ncbi:hypothetical protein B0H13DRAFT_1921273 [Mycena leptocephala]|nr:hypothetical protein B0H13DRAFT_1921273 [Mycena leptocephala]
MLANWEVRRSQSSPLRTPPQPDTRHHDLKAQMLTLTRGNGSQVRIVSLQHRRRVATASPSDVLTHRRQHYSRRRGPIASSGSDWRKWSEKAGQGGLGLLSRACIHSHMLRFLRKIDDYFESASSSPRAKALCTRCLCRVTRARRSSFLRPALERMSGVRQHPKEQLPQLSPGRTLQHHCLGTPWRFLDYSASEHRDPAMHTSDTGSGHPLHERALRHTFSVAFLARLAMMGKLAGRRWGESAARGYVPISPRASFLSLTDEVSPGVALLERTVLIRRHTRKIDRYTSDMRAPFRACTRLRSVVLNNGPWLHESIWSSDAGSQEWAFQERDIGIRHRAVSFGPIIMKGWSGDLSQEGVRRSSLALVYPLPYTDHDPSGTDFPGSSDKVATASSTNVSSLTVAPSTLKGAEWGVSRRKALLPVISWTQCSLGVLAGACAFIPISGSLHPPPVSFLHLDDLSGPSSEYPSFVGASMAGTASAGTRRGRISPLPRHLASRLGGEAPS